MSANPFIARRHQRQAVDAALDAYVEWREHCAAVWDAYHRWSRTLPKDNARAHAAYQATLDREEAAATAYAALLEQATKLLEESAEAPTRT